MYLNAESAIDLRNTFVVLPDDTELDDALRNLDDIKSFLVVRVGSQERLQALGKLVQCLQTLD